MRHHRFFIVALTVSASTIANSAEIERIWLTHKTNDPSEIVVNWTSPKPGVSAVRIDTPSRPSEIHTHHAYTLHHMEIPFPQPGITTRYSVRSSELSSDFFELRGYPTDVLRVAVVANWHTKTNLDALIKENVHLLLTAGDNVPDLWHDCGAGNKDCVKPYEKLIDAYPAFFRSTPFMPALGNHDKEFRPRGNQAPPDPVYDIDATAYREFFELPGDEWKWHFDIPGFPVRFIALDLNHLSDLGTTYQSCHDFRKDSEQFRWYESLMNSRPDGFVVTIYNERNSVVRSKEDGAWGKMIQKGSFAITGFGHFAERAEVDGFTYLNTSLSGKGARYNDPKSKAFFNENNYLLMTFDKAKNSVLCELKSLSGASLDQIRLNPDGKPSPESANQ